MRLNRFSLIAAVGLFAVAGAAALARTYDAFERATESIVSFAAAALAFAFPASPRLEVEAGAWTTIRVAGRAETRSFRERFLARMPKGYGRAPLVTAFVGA